MRVSHFESEFVLCHPSSGSGGDWQSSDSFQTGWLSRKKTVKKIKHTNIKKDIETDYYYTVVTVEHAVAMMVKAKINEILK